MKYIPGYKFKIGSKVLMKRPAITSVKDMISKNSKKDVSNVIPELKENNEYIIHNIRPDHNNKTITYIFKSKVGLTSVVFSSIEDAEKKLDMVLGVQTTNEVENYDNENKKQKLNEAAVRYFKR